MYVSVTLVLEKQTKEYIVLHFKKDHGLDL